MPQRWSDNRLDAFEAHVDQRFDAVDQRFDMVEQRIDLVNERLEDVGKRLDRGDSELSLMRSDMNGRLEHLGHRVDDLHRTLQRIGGGMLLALIGLVATQL